MPNNDRTGPKGMGSQTGRGTGLCNPAKKRDLNDSPAGQRLGHRQGRRCCQGGPKRQGPRGGQFGGIVQLDDGATSSEQDLRGQIQNLQDQLETLREALHK